MDSYAQRLQKERANRTPDRSTAGKQVPMSRDHVTHVLWFLPHGSW